MFVETLFHPISFWIILGGLLLATEMLTTSGVLLWCGTSAMIVATVVWLIPLSWNIQGVLFAFFTLLSALIWYWVTKHKAKQSIVLNQRGAEMIGRHFILEEALNNNGYGRVRIGDSSWRVVADKDLPKGDKVIVTAIEGITLRVEPYQKLQE